MVYTSFTPIDEKINKIALIVILVDNKMLKISIL